MGVPAMRILLSLIVGLMTSSVAFGADVSGDKVLVTTGKWTVRLTPDLLTGKKACTGLYENKYIVQLTNDALFFSQAPNGGLKAYTVQFDEGPASAQRDASPFERDIQSAALRGDDFKKALTSKRVRLHITTAGDRIADDDVDLSGIDTAHKAIVGDKDCR